jgi:hypothetical protein
MAWPRIKQPDEPTPSGGQNAGISGTRHSVADQGGTGSHRISDRGSRSFRALLGPIRYAHGGGNPPDNPPAPAASAETVAAEVLSSKYDYEQTAGLVYESPPAPPEAADEAPRNEGIGIFSRMNSGDAPEDQPTVSFNEPLSGPSPRGVEPPTAEMPAVDPQATGPRTRATQPRGPSWNEPIAAAPRPVETGPAGMEPAEPMARSAGTPEDRPPRSVGLLRGSIRIGAAPEDDSPPVRMRDLPPDVQLRFYRLRATIMVVVGIVFAVLTRSWEIALTLAILAGIVDTIYRSRNAHNYASGAIWGGARKRTRKQLARLRRSGYFALDARPIPNSREFIDHLVVGPTGVYAIDSEKWDAKMPIRTWNGKKLYHGPESQKDRLEHAVWEARQASEILSAALGYEVKVRPALAIYGPKIPWDIATIRGVDVFTGSALGKYLRRRGRQKDGVVPLTREEVRTIYDTATRMLPDVTASTRTYTPVG